MMLKKVLLLSALSLTAASAMAAACDYELGSTDQMTYVDVAGKPVAQIEVPAACKDFTINLKHVGKLPKTAMGHNVVIAKTADVKGIAADGLRAGVANDYVKQGDARVVAYSKMIGGGEKTAITFPVAKIKGGDYDFFCSFPGHEMKMHGKLIVK